MVETPTRTSVSSYLAELYAEIVRERTSEPVWWKERRRAAFERYQQQGLPNRTIREWKGTNLAALQRLRPMRSGDDPKAAALAISELAPLIGAAHGPRLYCVDGHIVPPSKPADLGTGVSLLSFNQALCEHESLLARHLGLVASSTNHSFEALNLALLEDGVLVYLAARVDLRAPLELVHLYTRRSAHAAVQTRTLVVLDPGARLQLIERYISQPLANGWSNSVCEVQLGRGAHLSRIAIEERSPDSLHLAKTHARLEREASLHNYCFMFGQGSARDEVEVEMQGEAAQCELDGLYLGHRSRSVECRTVVDHATERATSRQDYRGILAENARGSFAGKVLVRQGAQKSTARQSNRNLLLSPGAIADTSPELSILADDVVCSHGATVGELDENQIFYLRSRGIDEATARALLIHGFAQGVSHQLEPAALRRWLERRVIEELSSDSALPTLPEDLP